MSTQMQCLDHQIIATKDFSRTLDPGFWTHLSRSSLASRALDCSSLVLLSTAPPHAVGLVICSIHFDDVLVLLVFLVALLSCLEHS